MINIFLLLYLPIMFPEEPISVQKEAPPLNAATLSYGDNNSARCFSNAFLRDIREKTRIKAPEKLSPIKLSGEMILKYPFCLLSGEGYFHLSDIEKANLRSYLLQGGFILASAGCSSSAWDASFREQIKEVFPEFDLEILSENHAIFSFLYSCAPLKTKDQGLAHLEALYIEGRIALVYSQAGLNDTQSISNCCCCTGNEVLNSSHLNANIFLYALLGDL